MNPEEVDVNPLPVMALPDARIITTDTVGMQDLSPASVPVSRVAATQWVQTVQETQGSTDDQQQARVAAGGSVAHDVETAPDRYMYMAADTMPDSEKINSLLWALQHMKEAMDRKDRELDETRSLNHTQAEQLSAARLKTEDLTHKVSTQASEIRELKAKLQQMVAQSSVIRVGTKRGRFVLSVSPVLECINCHRMFDSESAAHSSSCAHHPKPACPLSEKMIPAAELSRSERLSQKHRYWPCCKQISIETPMPCFHGRHSLRAL